MAEQQNVITLDLIMGMVRHWMATRANGYIGSRYGSDPLSLLHEPLNSLAADEYMAKMRQDLPILNQLGDAVNIYQQTEGNDKKRIFIEISGQIQEVTPVENTSIF